MRRIYINHTTKRRFDFITKLLTLIINLFVISSLPGVAFSTVGGIPHFSAWHVASSVLHLPFAIQSSVSFPSR